MTRPDDRMDEQDEGPHGFPPEEEPVPAEPAPHDVHPDDAAHRQTKAQLQRAMADMANLRKRVQKDLEDARTRAVEGLAAELLPVLDNFHLALGVANPDGDQGTFDPKTMVEGMRMVRSLLESVLERHGLSAIPAEGRTFDPNLHEAVGVDNETAAEPGQVTQVVLRGYRIGDKVLRASRVLVRGDGVGDGAPSGRRSDQTSTE